MSWKVNHQRVQKAAERLLSLVQTSEPPVSVEEIAQRRGIQVRSIPYDDTLAGLLLWEGGLPIIGINALHDTIRQRFAIAHELAHIELRHHTGVHIDRAFPSPFSTFSAEQAAAIAPTDFEASVIACQILLPTALLAADLRGKTIDFIDDTFVRTLAQRYQVSHQTVLLRIALEYVDASGHP